MGGWIPGFWCVCLAFLSTGLVSSQEDCRNSYIDDGSCYVWAARGDCATNPGWMVPNCRQACGACTSYGCFNLYESDRQCEEWAVNDECFKNPIWMSDNCEKSCGLCEIQIPDNTTLNLPDESTDIENTSYDDVITTDVPSSDELGDNDVDPTTEQTSLNFEECENSRSDQECLELAANGECARNPVAMVTSCRKACGACSEYGCSNQADSEAVCKTWVSRGDCQTSSRVQRICRQSCGRCPTYEEYIASLKTGNGEETQAPSGEVTIIAEGTVTNAGVTEGERGVLEGVTVFTRSAEVAHTTDMVQAAVTSGIESTTGMTESKTRMSGNGSQETPSFTGKPVGDIHVTEKIGTPESVDAIAETEEIRLTDSPDFTTITVHRTTNSPNNENAPEKSETAAPSVYVSDFATTDSMDLKATIGKYTSTDFSDVGSRTEKSTAADSFGFITVTESNERAVITAPVSPDMSATETVVIQETSAQPLEVTTHSDDGQPTTESKHQTQMSPTDSTQFEKPMTIPTKSTELLPDLGTSTESHTEEEVHPEITEEAASPEDGEQPLYSLHTTPNLPSPSTEFTDSRAGAPVTTLPLNTITSSETITKRGSVSRFPVVTTDPVDDAQGSGSGDFDQTSPDIMYTTKTMLKTESMKPKTSSQLPSSVEYERTGSGDIEDEFTTVPRVPSTGFDGVATSSGEELTVSGDIVFQSTTIYHAPFTTIPTSIKSEETTLTQQRGSTKPVAEETSGSSVSPSHFDRVTFPVETTPFVESLPAEHPTTETTPTVTDSTLTSSSERIEQETSGDLPGIFATLPEEQLYSTPRGVATTVLTSKTPHPDDLTSSGDISDFSTAPSTDTDVTEEDLITESDVDLSGEELFTVRTTRRDRITTTLSSLPPANTIETSLKFTQQEDTTVVMTAGTSVATSVDGIPPHTSTVISTTEEALRLTTPSPTSPVTPPSMYVSNETHILLIEENVPRIIISQPGGNIVGLAVDEGLGLLFWSNNAFQYRGVYSSTTSGFDVKRIAHKDVVEVNGLSVDPASRLLFWTDAQRRHIQVSTYDGVSRKTIIRNGLRNPRGIVLDSKNKYMYWNDQSTRKIERSRYDGTAREILLEGEDVYWPNQMALTENKRELVWGDAWLHHIKIFNVEDKTLRSIVVDRETENRPIYGLVVKGSQAYFSVWALGSILSVDMATLEVKEEHTGLSTDVMFGMALKQADPGSDDHPCGFQVGFVCPDLCLPTSAVTHVCACADYGGLLLSDNGRTCASPEAMLIFAMMDRGEVAFMPVGSPSNNNIGLVGRSSRPVGVAYDPITQIVYWSDVQERQLYRAPLDGSEKQVFMNITEGLGFVEGLAMDWQNRNLYFTNADFVTIDGTAFSWHKIEVVNVDTMARRVIVSDVEQPRGIYIDGGFLFYTDWGKEPKVIRCNLDGTDPVIIMREENGMQVPNGAVSIGSSVYVIDSNFKAREMGYEDSSASLFRFSNGDVSQVDIDPALEIPFAITKMDTTLIISDWGTESLVAYDVTTGEYSSLLGDVVEPTGVLYTSRMETLSQPEPDGCRGDSCEGLCLASRADLPTCQCDSYELNWLRNSPSCSAAENFIIVSDMNTIRYRSLSPNDSNSLDYFIIYEGDKYFSSFSALAYNEEQQTIYFTDVNRGTIESVSLLDKAHDVILSSGDIIDDIFYEPISGHLYWTEAERGCIRRAPTYNMSLATDLLCELKRPQALEVATLVGYLFWVEQGNSPSVWRSRMDGSEKEMIWKQNGSLPSALHFEQKGFNIFILDSVVSRIYRCALDGESCVSFTDLPVPSSVFHFVVFEQHIIYSDWDAAQVIAYDTVTNNTQTLLSDLMRPTRFIIHHPASIQDNCRESRCSDVCVPVLASYQCQCEPMRYPIDEYRCQSAPTTPSVSTLPVTTPTATDVTQMTVESPSGDDDLVTVPGSENFTTLATRPALSTSITTEESGQVTTEILTITSLSSETSSGDALVTEDIIFSTSETDTSGFTDDFSVTDSDIFSTESQTFSGDEDETIDPGYFTTKFSSQTPKPSVSGKTTDSVTTNQISTVSGKIPDSITEVRTATEARTFEGTASPLSVSVSSAYSSSEVSKTRAFHETTTALFTKTEEAVTKSASLASSPETTQIYATSPSTESDKVPTVSAVAMVTETVPSEDSTPSVTTQEATTVTTSVRSSSASHTITPQLTTFSEKASEAATTAASSTATTQLTTAIPAIVSMTTTLPTTISTTKLTQVATNSTIPSPTTPTSTSITSSSTITTPTTTPPVTTTPPTTSSPTSTPTTTSSTIATSTTPTTNATTTLSTSTTSSTTSSTILTPTTPTTTELTTPTTTAPETSTLTSTRTIPNPTTGTTTATATTPSPTTAAKTTPTAATTPEAATTTITDTTATTTPTLTATTATSTTSIGKSSTTPSSATPMTTDTSATTELTSSTSATTTRITSASTESTTIVVPSTSLSSLSTSTMPPTTTEEIRGEPQFVYCPDDISVYVKPGQTTKQIWWREPAVAEDALGDDIVLSSTHVSGDHFQIGLTGVAYTATNTHQSLSSNCTFSVEVKNQEFYCEDTPDIINGKLVCRHDNFIYKCKAQCHNGYVTWDKYNQEHMCGSHGWMPDFSAGYSHLACMRDVSDSKSVEITIAFTGSCNQVFNSEVQEEFKAQIIQEIRHSNVCNSEDLLQLCSEDSYSVDCAQNQRRRKRETQQEEILMIIQLWVLDRGDINSHLKPLENMAANGELAAIVNGAAITSTTMKGIQIKDIDECPPGSISYESLCLLCPSGTYLTGNTCKLCGQGSYQMFDGQSRCDQCTRGETSPAGSFLSEQCHVQIDIETTSVPEDESYSIPLVIALGSIGGLLFLGVIIFGIYTCYRLHKQEQKLNQFHEMWEYYPRKRQGKLQFDHEKDSAYNVQVRRYREPEYLIRPASPTTEYNGRTPNMRTFKGTDVNQNKSNPRAKPPIITKMKPEETINSPNQGYHGTKPRHNNRPARTYEMKEIPTTEGRYRKRQPYIIKSNWDVPDEVNPAKIYIQTTGWRGLSEVQKVQN